jgi:hypothetical protein
MLHGIRGQEDGFFSFCQARHLHPHRGIPHRIPGASFELQKTIFRSANANSKAGCHRVRMTELDPLRVVSQSDLTLLAIPLPSIPLPFISKREWAKE